MLCEHRGGSGEKAAVGATAAVKAAVEAGKKKQV